MIDDTTMWKQAEVFAKENDLQVIEISNFHHNIYRSHHKVKTNSG